ncbi:MAG: hypothetical protein LBL28_00815 [Treponema sp.]|jgi:hypothetical protein|nr:hypothetical protein [Treponema sp.]
MKRSVIVVCGLLGCLFPLFAQIRNGQRLNLYSWTKDGKETGMVEQVSDAVVQTTSNEIKYTMRIKNGDTIVINFDRISKRLHYISKPEHLYSTTGTFRESGSTSIFTFTGEMGEKNVLKFKRI